MNKQLTIPGLAAHMGEPLGDPATRAAIREQDNRVALLEALYTRDGRDKSDHPLGGTYTGLMSAFRYKLGQLIIDAFLRDPGQINWDGISGLSDRSVHVES
jgi:hypothetical protein